MLGFKFSLYDEQYRISTEVHKEAWTHAEIFLKDEAGLLWEAWKLVLFGNSLFSVERQSEAGWRMQGANFFVSLVKYCSLPLNREIGLFIFIITTFRILKMDIMITVCQACTSLSVTFIYDSGWTSKQKSEKFCFISRLLE